MKTFLLFKVLTSALCVVSGRSLKEMVTSNFVGEGSNDLTAHLLQSEVSSGLNSVFSPLGTNAILAILAEGARGETRNQLAKALSHPEDTYAVRSTYKTIFTSMSEHGVLNQPEFKSWFYVYKNNSIEESYKAVMKENYLIEINEVDRYTDIDGEESEHEGSLAIKFSSHSESSGPQHDSKTEDDKGASSSEQASDNDVVKDKSEDAKKPSDGVADNIAQESTKKKEDEKKYQETVTAIATKLEETTEDNKIEGAQALGDEREQPVVDVSAEATTQAAAEEVTTESVSDNQVDQTDEGQADERPVLEDIIARSLKSEIRSEREMVSALSANRLSSLNEDLRPNSRMIIFNALYFRGNWSVPMKSKDEKMPFYTSGKAEQVDAMSGEGELQIGTVPELGATVLELPYQGEKYSMLIILPDDKNGLSGVVNKLSGNSVRKIGQHLNKRLVKACMPKFRFYTISKPKDALLKSGIKDIFGDQADLTGITPMKGLYLDDLVQLVTLDVDESHSSNTQLTSGMVSETRVNPAIFKADRPFAFVVRDRTDNLVIVAGIVRNPKNPDIEEKSLKKDN